MTADDRDVLELRVHGVNNTPPAAMLDLPPDDVVEVLGDDRAGFWRPKRPEGAAGADSRGHVPAGITREAYSWGGLARGTPGGRISAGNRAVAALVTAGWTLLLPFGLANVAYWTRSVESWSKRQRTPGEALVRVFGLCLTAFLVVTVCDVSLDLVATQCYQQKALVCSRVPGLLAGLGAADPAVRLAVFSMVPIAVLVGLWLLTSISRSRYERAFGNAPVVVPAPDDDVAAPVLADRELWKGDVMVAGLARVHLALGLAVVTICLTWPAVFSTGPHCRTTRSLGHAACWRQVGSLPAAAWGYGVALVAAVVVVLAAVALTIRGTGRPLDAHGRVRQDGTRPMGILLLASAVTLLVAEAFLVVVRPGLEVGGALVGVNALPTALLIVMLAIAVAALFVRLSPWSGRVWALLLLAALCWVVVDGRAGAVAVLVVLLGMVGHLAVVSRSRGEWQAWSGCAPGVFLGTALLAQNVLSSVVVLVVGDWLNGSNGASTLVPKGPGRVGRGTCEKLAGGHGACLTVPVPYLLLGAVGVVSVLVVVVVAAVAYVRSGSDLPDPDIRAVGFRATVRNAIRSARLAHRAEKLVGVLAWSGLLLTLAATVASAAGWLDLSSGEKPTPVVRSLDLTTAAVAALGLLALGALVKGSGNGSRRPLGVVWDLVSFLPRAAHPFAPPCYAERAVPELTDRVSWWLAQPDRVVAGQRRGGTKVVLSAHSLGGVLAVAALMRPLLQEHENARRIRLLTYGSQLRAFFSRIFPELLGPSVLGTAPTLAASLWSADPWLPEKEQESGHPRPSTPATGTVVARAPWRNLWRSTDYIGFPVSSFEKGPIDRVASEVDDTSYLLEVLTHSDYPRTPQYRRALEALARLPAGPKGP